MFTACSLDYLIDRKEDKIIGTWEFDKVTYKKDNALFRKDITHQYRNDIIQFFPDYSAVYDDYSLNAIFDGWWSVIVDEDICCEGGEIHSDREFFLDAVFYDFLNGEDFYLFGSIDRVNNRKMHLEAFDNHGKYIFKLRKL
jgi:hypothetical protein